MAPCLCRVSACLDKNQPVVSTLLNVTEGQMGTHHWKFLMLPFESGEQTQCIAFRGRLGIVDPVTNHQSIVALPAASRPGSQFDECIGRNMRFQCFSQGDFPEGADAVPGKSSL